MNDMDSNLDPLIFDLLEWIAREPRSYADVIETWRTSCPRLTVWEDCVDRGLATRIPSSQGRLVMVGLTEAGWQFLHRHRPTGGQPSAVVYPAP